MFFPKSISDALGSRLVYFPARGARQKSRTSKGEGKEGRKGGKEGAPWDVKRANSLGGAPLEQARPECWTRATKEKRAACRVAFGFPGPPCFLMLSWSSSDGFVRVSRNVLQLCSFARLSASSISSVEGMKGILPLPTPFLRKSVSVYWI